MKKPHPAEGLVIRYDYLWRDEAKRGRIEGAKERPCAIIVAIQAGNSSAATVLLAPITHSLPGKADHAVEIPAAVKCQLGLDSDRSWIVYGELNSVAWSDPGIVPASRTRWEYGYLPAKLAASLRNRIIELNRAGKLGMTDRQRTGKGSRP